MFKPVLFIPRLRNFAVREVVCPLQSSAIYNSRTNTRSSVAIVENIERDTLPQFWGIPMGIINIDENKRDLHYIQMMNINELSNRNL